LSTSSQTGKILNVSYYQNYCIGFNQILHNDRNHQLVIMGGPKKSNMADGRHFKKSSKLPYICSRLTDFDEIWQGDAH